MNVYLQSEIHYIREAFLFLKRYTIDKDFKKINSVLKHRPNYISNMKEIVNAADSIFQELINFVIGDKEKLTFYFLPIVDNEFESMADFITMPYLNGAIKDIERQKEYIKQKFHKDNGMMFISYVMSHEDLFLESDKNKIGEFNQDEVITLLDKTEYSDAQKWKFGKVYYHFDSYVDELFTLIEPIVPKLKELYQKTNNIDSLFKQYWENSIQNQNFEVDFYSNTRVKLHPNIHNDIVILPSLMGCDMIFVREEDFVQNEEVYIYIGLLFFSENYIYHEQYNDNELCTKLKLISDNSKFEILKYIKNRPAYGQEIANKLNLTTATISHHMHKLTNDGLIRIETENNRVYYQLDQNTIQLIIKTLQEKLL